ncbi:ABC transporter ATP-binding protein [Dactylosporangium sucinum]|uniref:ABC transporter ATP-binding protein n=1 Tax=Dactylosporangium sucinum TaxID=1424081 RepID=A0A917X3T8_9ACTN|nr:ABC transporter ATP-binding protein [Dactylosporangium sucinum]GGM62005.1 ABC transporter ATP-binding protein [Dactylosporangium sucinum]
MLEISNLTTHYFQGGQVATAVRGASLTLKKGLATAIVGESGSGKSTVAMSVMRMIRPPIGDIAEGTIRVNGTDVTAASPKQMREILRTSIGFVPQDPTTALDPLYTIRSQIVEAMPHVERNKRTETIVELLTSLGIADARDRLREHPHQFSGGMRQRVAIAIALAKEPDLLIADEPTTALDVTTQIGILRLLDRLRRERHLTTMFITHDIRVARLVCQDVAVMYGGVVVESGPLSAVVDAPSHPYTRALLDASSLDVGPRQRLRAISGSPPTLLAMPPGCPFAPRCPNATAICHREMPATTGKADGSSFACWNPVAS